MKSLIVKLENFYRNLRESAEKKAEYFNALAEKDPEYLLNSKKLRELELAAFRAEYDRNTADLNKLNAEIGLLRLKNTEILKKLGIDEKDLTPKYLCEKCNDKGYVDSSQCGCYLENLSKLKTDILREKEMNFPLFSQNSSKGLAQRYDKMLEYCEKFPNTKIRNFLFTGKPGTGKSRLAGCIAGELSGKGYNVLFLTAFALNNIFLKYHTTFDSEKYLLLDSLTGCDLLVIDDLGTEPVLKNVTKEYLNGLIGDRQQQKKHTVITTNLSTDEILDRYEERFFSRISNTDECAVFNFTGKDLRLSK